MDIKIDARSIIENEINKKIKRKQSKLNSTKYKYKNPDDKLECIVCGGKFIRRIKCVHDRTSKHKKALEDIYDKVISDLS